MKSSVLAAAALSVAALGLVSCGDSAPEQPVEAPEGVPGLTVTNARLVLPPVEGNPAAVYFDLAYEGDRNVALTRAHVQGAESATQPLGSLVTNHPRHEALGLPKRDPRLARGKPALIRRVQRVRDSGELC